MRRTILYRWILACIAYGFAIIMAFHGRLEASIPLTMIYLLIMIGTRWTKTAEKLKAHTS